MLILHLLIYIPFSSLHPSLFAPGTPDHFCLPSCHISFLFIPPLLPTPRSLHSPQLPRPSPAFFLISLLSVLLTFLSIFYFTLFLLFFYILVILHLSHDSYCSLCCSPSSFPPLQLFFFLLLILFLLLHLHHSHLPSVTLPLVSCRSLVWLNLRVA